MKQGVQKFSLIMLVSLLLSFSTISATEKIPDDVRYMLEDMYGADKQKWPALINKKDLNHDGFSDWLVQKNNCLTESACPAEIFICLPDKQGVCVEYCYSEIKDLKQIKNKFKNVKCESTC